VLLLNATGAGAVIANGTAVGSKKIDLLKVRRKAPSSPRSWANFSLS
jgi:hypothetical protein